MTPFDLGLVDDPAYYPELVKDLATKTALLPHCTICFLTWKHDHPSQPSTSSPFFLLLIPEALDLCRCATNILTSRCAYCALSTIHNSLHAAMITRARHDLDGLPFLVCECGSQVMVQGDIGELVRKCMSCNGIVTAPFHDWEGREVVFGIKRWDVNGIDPM